MIYTYDIPSYSYNERQLGNGKYRYTGRYAGIAYTVDSENKLTQEYLFEELEKCSIDYLLDMEGYIISL